MEKLVIAQKKPKPLAYNIDIKETSLKKILKKITVT